MQINPICLKASVVAFVALLITGVSHADHVVISGTFEGRSDHELSGKVSVLHTAKGYVVQLAEDFSLDGAPDPKLGFGKDGYEKSTQFSKLRQHKGAQSYELPAGFDPSGFNEIWVWCEKFDVPLGVAKLK